MGISTFLSGLTVSVIIVTLALFTIIVSFINLVYFYLKEHDTTHKMSVWWEKILFWINIISTLFLGIITLYFITRLIVAVSKSGQPKAKSSRTDS